MAICSGDESMLWTYLDRPSSGILWQVASCQTVLSLAGALQLACSQDGIGASAWGCMMVTAKG